MSIKKSIKAEIVVNSGFNSRLRYNESRSSSGFHTLKNDVGQIDEHKPVMDVYSILQAMKIKADEAPYRLCRPYIGPKECFVEFYYFDRANQKYVRQKIRLKKRGLTEAQKKAQLQIIATKFNKVLVDRNNKGLYHDEFVMEHSDFNLKFSIPDAIWFIRSSNDDKISEDRLNCLRETAGIFNEFYEAQKALRFTKITALSDAFLDIFIKWCKAAPKSGKTINKYLGTLQFATEWLKRKGHIEKSFDTKPLRVAQPKNETGRFPPLTHDEKLSAFSYFKKNNPDFHLYLFFTYYTCIRGAELYKIKVKNIDFVNRKIFLKWLDTKNGLSNFVQILEPLYQLLIERGVDKLDAELYLFTTKFKPGKERYKGGQSSDYWMRARKYMNMPIEKQAYGLKHTFNVDYIENNKDNVNWEWLRRHNRHATIQQTQQYISTLTAYFLDETKSTILNYF